MAKGKRAVLQPANQAHLRYKKIVEAIVAAAPASQRDNLRGMIIREFLRPQNEENTVLGNNHVYGFSNRDYLIEFGTNKTLTFRTKTLAFSIGRHPEQSSFADRMRSINFVFKFLLSITETQMKTMTNADAKNIFVDTDDDRFALQTADRFGGPSAWFARRKRFENEDLHPERLRRRAGEIFAMQEQQREGRTDLASTLTKTIVQIQSEHETNSRSHVNAIRNYFFSASGSKQQIETSVERYLTIHAGGAMQYVDLADDLRSPCLRDTFNRATDMIIFQDDIDAVEVPRRFGISARTYAQIRKILPYVNEPTYLLHEYIDRLVELDVDWSANVDADAIATFLPPGGTIFRMKYAANGRLEIHSRHYRDDILAACRDYQDSARNGFIYKYKLARRAELTSQRKRSASA